VTVARLAVDRTTNTPVVFLREAVGDRGCAIWIGAAEAHAIALALAGDAPPRPLTHDLAAALLAALGATLTRATITGVRDGTYLAEVLVTRADGEVLSLDARPSDAIALAMRADAPLLASTSLLRLEGAAGPESPEPLDAEALRAHLRQLDPEDFGRFTP
jgi:bifunctional DNase/RNase